MEKSEVMENKGYSRMIVFMILKTFLVVMVLVAAGVVSYFVTLKYYEIADEKNGKDAVLDIVGDVTADEISRNIIYSVDNDKGKIKAIVIEILNTKTGNLDYLTIPVESEITISNDTYQRMCAAGVDAPQIVRLEKISKYFDDDRAYEYGILILEDSLGIDIGYYTKMESSVFDSVFVMSETLGCYQLTDAVKNEAAGYTQADEIEGMIKTWYDKFESNLKVKTKLKYAETYFNVDPQFIYYNVVPGESVGDIYEIDVKEAKKQYKTLLSSPAYTVSQEDAIAILSIDKNIKVLNGSGVEGIAAAAKSMLAEEGLNVVKIADNPEVIEQTIIRVSKEGMGVDLLHFFNDAQIEVGELDEGIDIIIIVGSNDSEIINR